MTETERKNFWDNFEKNPIIAVDRLFGKLEELEKENERLKEKLKSQQMINLKQQEIALDYWNALEEIKDLMPKECFNKEQCNFCPHKNAKAKLTACIIVTKINEALTK